MSDRSSMMVGSDTLPPALRLFRIAMVGVMAAFSVAIWPIAIGEFQWGNLIVYGLEGMSISVLWWGAERLWLSTVGGMVRNPSRMLAYLTRLPLWYMAGGIGTTLAFLIAVKTGSIDLPTAPIKPVFVVGGKVGVLVGALASIPQFRKGSKQPGHTRKSEVFPRETEQGR